MNSYTSIFIKNRHVVELILSKSNKTLIKRINNGRTYIKSIYVKRLDVKRSLETFEKILRHYKVLIWVNNENTGPFIPIMK